MISIPTLDAPVAWQGAGWVPQNKRPEGNVLLEFRRQPRILCQQARELEGALSDVRGSSFRAVQNSVGRLREICRTLQEGTQFGFGRTENRLFSAVDAGSPRGPALAGELRSELGQLRQLLEDFRVELIHFNASGELRQLPRLGQELVGALRQYADRVEQELFPLLRTGVRKAKGRGQIRSWLPALRPAFAKRQGVRP